MFSAPPNSPGRDYQLRFRGRFGDLLHLDLFLTYEVEQYWVRKILQARTDPIDTRNSYFIIWELSHRPSELPPGRDNRPDLRVQLLGNEFGG